MPSESPVADAAEAFASARNREDVQYVEDERAMPEEKYEPLSDHYEQIDGVVMVGLVHEGAVLVQGVDQFSPPGGHVPPGGDWEATAREAIEDHTGREVEIEDVVCAERTYFHLEGDPETRFPADVLHYRATLAEDAPELIADPEPPEDFDPPVVEDDETLRLQWVEEVTDEVNPNHAEHVELFLDDE